jgi:hypothetical protein
LKKNRNSILLKNRMEIFRLGIIIDHAMFKKPEKEGG